jgi:hypothetical protein
MKEKTPPLTRYGKQKEEINLKKIKKEALAQLRPGQSLYGKAGAFAPLLQSFLE